MKTQVFIIRLSLMLMVIFSSLTVYGESEPYAKGADPMPLASSDELAVLQFLNDYQHAYNSREAKAVAELYSADAVWMAAAGAVFEGRVAITEALEYFMANVPPRLNLNNVASYMFDTHGVMIGTYTLRGDGGAERSIVGGAYLNLLQRDGGSWQIIHQQMNYDLPMIPEMWVGSLGVVRALPEEGSLANVARAIETHYAEGDMTSLVKLLSKANRVAFAGQALQTGRELSSTVLSTDIGIGHCLSIHDVRTIAFADSMVIGTGWYEIIIDVTQIQWGTYTLLAVENSGGSWDIEWFVGTASPSGPKPLISSDPICLNP